MALMRKRHQRTDSLKNIFTDTTGGGRIVLRNESPNLSDVPRC